MFYFKFPRLGSYACYPIKYKNYLLEGSFDKGIVDYKQHLRVKEEIEKEFKEKLTELKAELDDAQKKFEEFEVTEEESSIADKASFQETFKKAEETYNQQESNPPKAP